MGDLGEEVGDLDAGEGFEDGGDLGDHGGHVVGDPVDAGAVVVAIGTGGDDGDTVDLGQGLGEGADDFGESGSAVAAPSAS